MSIRCGDLSLSVTVVFGALLMHSEILAVAYLHTH